MTRWIRMTAVVLAASALVTILFAASAEGRGGVGAGFGGRRVGGKGAKRSGTQAQTLIDNAVRSDNVRRARHAMR